MNSVQLSPTVQKNITNKIIYKLTQHYIPWQKPWKGHGIGVGTARNVFTKQKYAGINLILLNMTAKDNGFTSCWWGTAEQFRALGGEIKDSWGTEILLYKKNISSNKVKAEPIVVYNYEQVKYQVESLEPNYKLTPDYSLVDAALKATPANIVYNDVGEAWYYYPPNDFITLPRQEYFDSGLGGKPGYYEALAHELCHWSEKRLGLDIWDDEAIKELRAEIGSSFLVQDLECPHSIAYSNIDKWRNNWLVLLKNNPSVIMDVADEACRVTDYIESFGTRTEVRFNEAA